MNKDRPIISFTTDFGTTDGYTGVVKAVILGICRDAHIVDLTHELPAWDISAGAWVLGAACKYFPENTIHLAVVDPGVGSKRRGIVIVGKLGTFVGPDNGTFSKVLDEDDNWQAFSITNSQFWNEDVSNTFQARDLFGPVSAHLANGVKPEQIGPDIDPSSLLRLPKTSFSHSEKEIEGEIVYIDHFGNLITNIPGAFVNTAETCHLKEEIICKIGTTYSTVEPGEATVFCGSHGFAEIGVYKEKAAAKLKAERGDKVRLEMLS